MANHFYAYISRMRCVKRWALMRNTEPENIQEHSHMVAILAHALALLQNKHFGGHIDPGQAVLLALYHDATEILTGDLPTPIKYYNPALRASYKEVEETAANRLLELLPEELRADYAPYLLHPDPELEAVVKAADKLDAYLKCVKERKAGNGEFQTAQAQIWDALQANPLPALGYFIEHYLPSFELTLDELNGSTHTMF
mgnify:FL=1